MSLRIRLSRAGAKKRPYHRVVVADSRSPRDGRFIERIGSYNPMVPKDSEARFVLDVERFKYWVSKGAVPSERIARLASALGLCEKPKVPEQTKKNAPKAKAVERAKAAAEAAAKAAAEPAEASA